MRSHIEHFSHFMFRISFLTYPPITMAPKVLDENDYIKSLYDARDRAREALDRIKASETIRSKKRAEEAKKKRHEEAMKKGKTIKLQESKIKK